MQISETVHSGTQQFGVMLLYFAFSLLFTNLAYAVNPYPVEYANHGGQVGPDTNLVYNFEHLRKDQPPHIEMREENINKYRNRPRMTTPVPERKYPVDNGDMGRRNPLPYNAQQWDQLQKAPKYDGPVQNWKSVPAPPNFPHWESLAKSALTNPNNYENGPVFSQQPIAVPEEPAQYSGPDVYHGAQVASYVSTEAPLYGPSNPPMPPMQPQARHAVRSNPSGRSRGNQRSYNKKVDMEPSTTPASVPAPAQSRMPPPAVPTLSPWYDGF